MSRESVRELRSSDRRRWPRVTLAAPVHISKGAGEESGAVSRFVAQSTDLSPGGVRIVIGEGGRFVPGEILSVSVVIPWEARRAFPFSRIMGDCRVVRVNERSTTAEPIQQELALAFCGSDVTLLGAIVTAQ